MFRRSIIGVAICLVLILQIPSLLIIQDLLHRNAELERTLKTRSDKDQRPNCSASLPVASTNKLSVKPTASKFKLLPTRKKPRDFIPSKLTIVLYNSNDVQQLSASEITKRLEKLRKAFPSSLVLWSKDENGVIGNSVNRVISQITTEYFLLLESHVSLSDRAGEGIAVLWQTLETFPEVDIVGGSYLTRDNKLHLSCRRFRLCKWTFSESYEYIRSRDNVMICDGTSSSFMGRTQSVRSKTAGFDEKLPGLWVVKDFFLRAKASNVVVGTRCGVFFLVDRFESLYEAWNSRNLINKLIPFALKYKVLIFKDIDGNVIDLCSPTSPLSGLGVCIETNSHKLLLDGGHWAYKGTYAYPYIIKYLETTLRVLTEYLDRGNVSYFVDGGVSLGAVKMRSILPWDSGDIDIFIYGMHNNVEVHRFLKPLADEKGYLLRRPDYSDGVHLFCTPQNVGDLSGGIATIFHAEKVPAKSELIRMWTSGAWVSYKRDIFTHFNTNYGAKYLQHHMFHRGEEIAHCEMKGDHNACIPDFRSFLQGTGGTLREYSCEI